MTIINPSVAINLDGNAKCITDSRSSSNINSYPALNLGLINSQVGQVLILNSFMNEQGITNGDMQEIVNNPILDTLISPNALKETSLKIDKLLKDIFSDRIFYADLPSNVIKIPDLVSFDLNNQESRRIMTRAQSKYAAGAVTPASFKKQDKGLAFKYYFNDNGKTKVTGIRDMKKSDGIPKELSLISASNILVAHALDTHISGKPPTGSNRMMRNLGGNFFNGGGVIDALLVFAIFSENSFYQDDKFQEKVNDLASVFALGIEENIQYQLQHCNPNEDYESKIEQTTRFLVFLDTFSKLQPASEAIEVLKRLENSLVLIEPDIVNKKNELIMNGEHKIPLKSIKGYDNFWPKKSLDIIDNYLQKKLQEEQVWKNTLS